MPSPATTREVAWSVARGSASTAAGAITLTLPGTVAENDIVVIAVSLGASTSSDTITLTVDPAGADPAVTIDPATTKASTAGHSSHVYIFKAAANMASAVVTFTRTPGSTLRYAMAAIGIRLSNVPTTPVNAITNAVRTSTATTKVTQALTAAGRSTLQVTVVAESTSTSTTANTSWSATAGTTIAVQDNNGNTGGGAQSLAIGVVMTPRNTGNSLAAQTWTNNSGHLTAGSVWTIGITSPTTPARHIFAADAWQQMQETA